MIEKPYSPPAHSPLGRALRNESFTMEEAWPYLKEAWKLFLASMYSYDTYAEAAKAAGCHGPYLRAIKIKSSWLWVAIRARKPTLKSHAEVLALMRADAAIRSLSPKTINDLKTVADAAKAVEASYKALHRNDVPEDGAGDFDFSGLSIIPGVDSETAAD